MQERIAESMRDSSMCRGGLLWVSDDAVCAQRITYNNRGYNMCWRFAEDNEGGSMCRRGLLSIWGGGAVCVNERC